MALKQKDNAEPKRLNRAVGVGEALSGVLDPALKKRGFAGRDIISHWAAMAPAPYNQVALPDRLVWPRGEKSFEGATLYLRCARSHALALAHEGAMVAAAVNRYFGYLLVNEVRLSAEPFTPQAAGKPSTKLPAPMDAKVDLAVQNVADDGVRAALSALGGALAQRRRK